MSIMFIKSLYKVFRQQLLNLTLYDWCDSFSKLLHVINIRFVPQKMCANSDVGYDCTIVIPPYIHSSISRNGFVIDLRSCPLLTLYTKILASRDQIWLPGLWIFGKHGRDFLVRIVILNNWNNLRLLLYIDTRQYSL